MEDSKQHSPEVFLAIDLVDFLPCEGIDGHLSSTVVSVLRTTDLFHCERRQGEELWATKSSRSLYLASESKGWKSRLVLVERNVLIVCSNEMASGDIFVSRMEYSRMRRQWKK